jgi:hypothetical protein
MPDIEKYCLAGICVVRNRQNKKNTSH